jgi:hypothetical protein
MFLLQNGYINEVTLMKKLLFTTAISVAALSFNASAAIDRQKSFKFVGDTQYAGICQAAATDNVGLFKKSLKNELSWISSNKAVVMDTALDSESFQCAGMGVAEFAESKGSKNLLSYIAGEVAPDEIKSKYSFIGDTQYAGFCKAALTNDVKLFKRTVRAQIGSLASNYRGVLELVLDENNVQCSGLGLSEFSKKRNATKVVEFIANKKV